MRACVVLTFQIFIFFIAMDGRATQPHTPEVSSFFGENPQQFKLEMDGNEEKERDSCSKIFNSNNTLEIDLGENDHPAPTPIPHLSLENHLPEFSFKAQQVFDNQRVTTSGIGESIHHRQTLRQIKDMKPLPNVMIYLDCPPTFACVEPFPFIIRSRNGTGILTIQIVGSHRLFFQPQHFLTTKLGNHKVMEVFKWFLCAQSFPVYGHGSILKGGVNHCKTLRIPLSTYQVGQNYVTAPTTHKVPEFTYIPLESKNSSGSFGYALAYARNYYKGESKEVPESIRTKGFGGTTHFTVLFKGEESFKKTFKSYIQLLDISPKHTQLGFGHLLYFLKIHLQKQSLAQQPSLKLKEGIQEFFQQLEMCFADT